MNIQELFEVGMKRHLADLADPVPNYPVLELGPGNNPLPISDCYLEWPDWDGSKDPIPFADNSIGAIYAFHFFEHFTGEQVIRLLRECQRVLAPGGILTTVIPHHSAMIAYQDLDHKSLWTEESWRTLFVNSMYDKNREQPWRFKIHFNAIIGIVQRNLAIFTQLVKE